MCFVLRRVVLLYRQVIDTDEFYSLLDESLRCIQIEIGEVGMKLRFTFVPECGVASFEEYAGCVCSAVCENKLFIDDVQIVWHFDHLRVTDQHVERQRIDSRSTFDKVRGRIDVRAGVRTEVEHRNVRAVTCRQATPNGELDRRIAGPGRQ